MEKTIKGTGAKIGTIFSNVDRNMIEMVNVIVRLVYPDYRVVDYADPANPPSLLQENDCYLVSADGTVWGMTVQKDQLLRWDGSAWQIEPYKFSDWYDPLGAKVSIPILFEVEENTTTVGQIPEISETYTILQDEGVFTVDETGLIEFIVAPDYEVKNEYFLKVKTDKHSYSVSVNVTDVASEFELLYETTLLTATAF